jgi:alginate O-acetyltransferase complex protein AlgI
VKSLVNKITEKKPVKAVMVVVEPVVLVALFVVVTAFLVDGSFNPFLYFRF